MKLSDFIKKLQALEAEGHGDLPVCVADWQECYIRPNEEEAERITVEKRDYTPNPYPGTFLTADIVVIASDKWAEK